MIMQLIAKSKLPFEEDRLWIETIRPWLQGQGVQGNALDLANFVTTEMLNNVRDHSGSPEVEVLGLSSPKDFVIHIADTGVGLFQRLATGLGLGGPREAVIEVCKGKRTTDPEHHTGQGIFFSSNVCEWFCIEANGFAVSFTSEDGVKMLEFLNPSSDGTTIKFRVALDTQRTLRQVFDEYCPQPDINFTRTVIGLRLMAEADGSLVSRSQGRRLMAGLEQFEAVVLDFGGVAAIGQGFADEVFRVWRNSHIATELRAVNANAEVSTMLRQAGVIQ
jgi:hypothetical protein